MGTSSEYVEAHTFERGTAGAAGGGVPDGGRPAWKIAPLRIFAALALFVLTLAVFKILATPADLTIQGDEAGYIYQALSLQGGDLSYDARDQERWLSLGMGEYPVGLFTQAFEGGWAAAKPIGYSVVLAPFLWIFDMRGAHIVGAMLLIAYASCWYFGLRLRWGRPMSIIVTAVATVCSYVWFYAYSAHADLFVATLVGAVSYGCLRASLRAEPLWLWIACCAAGLLATEKIPALLALIPVLVVSASRMRRRHAVIGVAVLAVTGALTSIPYLYYSDGASWSAYGGERYYVGAATPWSGGAVDDLTRVQTDEVITLSYMAERLGSPSSDIPDATLTYVVGRHTGAMTFMPIVPLLVATSLMTLVRRRRRSLPRSTDQEPLSVQATATIGENDLATPCAGTDGVDPIDSDREGADDPMPPAGSEPHSLPMLAWAGISGLVLYAGFYILLFTNNYYGGYHSIGNRYFLQFSAAAMVVPVATRLSERAVLTCAGVATLWAVAILGPHLLRSDSMFNEFWRTSRAQRVLPYDGTQSHSIGSWTGGPDMAVMSGPWLWAASEMLSQTGLIVGDSIEVRAGRDEAGYVTHGPYIQMATGTYRATIVYRSSGTPQESVIHFDAAFIGVPAAATDLPGTSGALVTETIDFDVTRGVGWEFRSLWDGTGDVVLRSIAVERLASD